MVHRGAFLGSRKDFLVAQKSLYAAAVENGTAADALADIQRRYFKRYPIELSHDVEPTPEALAAVDDDAADPEPESFTLDGLTEEEVAKETERREARNKLVTFRKGQIKRWLVYQHMKDNNRGLKDSDPLNPIFHLRQKLTGFSTCRPRLKTAVNVWRKTEEAQTLLEAEVRRRVVLEGIPPKMMVAFRDRVARDLFGKLDGNEKERWKLAAEAEHKIQMAQWKKANEGPLSTDPADRQRCIQSVVQFAQPILDLICEGTGWKGTLLIGGPEPAHEGHLNIISVHSGTTSGDVKMNFGRAERAGFKKYFVPIFGHFLQNCYTPEECRARALPPDTDLERLDSLDLEEDGATLDTVEPKASKISSIALSISSSSSHNTSLHEKVSLSAASPLLSTAIAKPVSTVPPACTDSPKVVERMPTPTVSSDIINQECVTDIDSPVSSPAPSRVPSPAPSRIPSPAPSRVPSPAPSRVPSHPSTCVPSHPPSPVPSRPPSPVPSPVPSQHPSPATAILPSPVSTNVTTTSRLKRKMTDGVNREDSAPKKSRVLRSATSATSRMTGGSDDPQQPPSLVSTAHLLPAQPIVIPSWLAKAKDMLDSTALGKEWTDFVEIWYAYEKFHLPTRKSGRLGAIQRPYIISYWIKCARLPTYRPLIPDLHQYELDFHAWWTSLHEDAGVNDNEGWERVFKVSGINGFLSLAAGLFFWGVELERRGRDADRTSWLKMVEDCQKLVILVQSS